MTGNHVCCFAVPWVRIPLSPFFDIYEFNDSIFEKLIIARRLSFAARGAVAQLGECIPRTDEVTGSNPVCSIRNRAIKAQFSLL
jgi:hypothetical protein